MPFYRFLALNEHKQTISGMIISDSTSEAQNTLRQFCLQPLKVNRLFHLSLTRFNDIDRFELCYAISELLKAGVTLINALNALSQDQRDLKRRILCSTFEMKLRFGYGMNAFNQEEFFDQTAFHTLLRAEQSGNLTDIFATLAHYYKERHEHHKELQRILRYPIFLALILSVLIVILSTFVLPNLETLAPTVSHGFAHKSFRWFSKNLDHVALILLSVITLILFCKPLFYRIPIITRIYMSQFWHDLSFCLQHDISLIDSLTLSEKTLPLFFQKHITHTRDQLLDGISLGNAFQYLPAQSQTRSSLIALAEKTGDVTGIINHLSKMETTYINNLIKKLLSWTQPLLILIMGSVVLWILQATIVPLYDSLAELKD
jgi:general secretion pathway protein F